MRPIKAEQLLVNMMGLVTFPFIAQRVLTGVYGMNAEQYDRFLDERQRTVRDRAYLDAYRIYAFVVGGLATIGLIAFTVASENDALDVTITWEQGIGLTLFLLVLASVLPSMVVAIRDPGEPAINALR